MTDKPKNKMKNTLSQSQRQAIAEYYDADKVRLTVDGWVHVHTSRQRGDGGPTPWWMSAGRIDDHEIREIIA